VSKQRETCEEPVKVGKQKHLPGGDAEDVFILILGRFWVGLLLDHLL
jgi:hypothetical protein